MLGGAAGDGDRAPPVDAPWNSSHGTGYGRDEGRGSDPRSGTGQGAVNADRMDYGDEFGLDMGRPGPTRNPNEKQLRK